MEEWKNIDGFEGYQVSNFGRVKSLANNKSRKEKILKTKKRNNGYLEVSLNKDGKQYFRLIHRLVCAAFVKNPDNLPQVNHIDENKENNNVDNLEWCTPQYNVDYSKSKQVNQYDLNGNYIKTWKSVKEIERQLGYSQGNITQCCNGKRKSAYNYYWRYND